LFMVLLLPRFFSDALKLVQRQVGHDALAAAFIKDDFRCVFQDVFHGFNIHAFLGDVLAAEIGFVNGIETVGIAVGAGDGGLFVALRLLYHLDRSAARLGQDVLAVGAGLVLDVF